MNDQQQNEESLEMLDALEIGINLSDYMEIDNESEWRTSLLNMVNQVLH